MLAEGRSSGEIAAALGLSRNTVRRFARAASPEELLACDGTRQRASILDEHAPYLHQRWNSGCTNAALLWQEIRAADTREAAGRSTATSRASAQAPPSPPPPRPRRRSGP